MPIIKQLFVCRCLSHKLIFHKLLDFPKNYNEDAIILALMQNNISFLPKKQIYRGRAQKHTQTISIHFWVIFNSNLSVSNFDPHIHSFSDLAFCYAISQIICMFTLYCVVNVTQLQSTQEKNLPKMKTLAVESLSYKR